MNFWQGFIQNNFDQIFERDVTLEEVLDNEHLIMEYRNKNEKLLGLYIKYKNRIV